MLCILHRAIAHYFFSCTNHLHIIKTYCTKKTCEYITGTHRSIYSHPFSSLHIQYYFADSTKNFFLQSLLPNNRLSPKDIFYSTQSLSPWVNQFPHSHSAETKTHIHFRPKSTESFDLLGFSRQQNNCLHMAREDRKYVICLSVRPT